MKIIIFTLLIMICLANCTNQYNVLSKSEELESEQDSNALDTKIAINISSLKGMAIVKLDSILYNVIKNDLKIDLDTLLEAHIVNGLRHTRNIRINSNDTVYCLISMPIESGGTEYWGYLFSTSDSIAFGPAILRNPNLIYSKFKWEGRELLRSWKDSVIYTDDSRLYETEPCEDIDIRLLVRDSMVYRIDGFYVGFEL